MPRTHTYKMAKGYEKLPALHENTVTWTVPATIAEALKPGPDTGGAPYFASEEVLLAAAVNQLNIRKGHAIKNAATERKGKDEDGNSITIPPTVKTLADAQDHGRSVVFTASTRKRGENVKAKAERAKKLESKVAENISTLSEDVLRFLVSAEQITQADMDAELLRRKGAEPTVRRRPAGA